MAAKPATAANEPAVVQWFASLFGQCWKEPSTAEDLQFDDLNPVDRQAKAGQKKSKQSQTAGKEAAPGAAGSKGVPPTASRGEQVGNPFLIDNSVLQIKSHPGVAFRHSKSEADKVRSGPGPAKWGETVYGTEEGDGWLKVGNFYLPMMYQGVAIITPVAATTQPQNATGEAEVEAASKKGAAAAPQSPSRAPATPVRNLPSSPKNFPASPGASKKGEDEAAAEPEQLPPTTEEERIAAASSTVAKAEEPASKEPESEEAVVASEAKEEASTREEGAMPPGPWFAQPSVGTWLLPVPAARRRMMASSEQAKAPVDCHVEAKKETEACASVDTGCAEEAEEQVSSTPLEIPCAEKVEASTLSDCCLGDKLEASAAIEACSAEEAGGVPMEVCQVDDEKTEKIVTIDACCMDEHVRESAPVEAQEVEWHLRPSVGAWLHSIPPQGIASQ